MKHQAVFHSGENNVHVCYHRDTLFYRFGRFSLVSLPADTKGLVYPQRRIYGVFAD